MKLFITGGTGFIGSNFINAAHDEGHEIVALRRHNSTPKVFLKKQPHWIEGALDDDFKIHLSGIDVMIHLASHTPNPPYAKLSELIYWNVFAPLKLAEQANDMGIKNFIIAGSCFEYGETANEFKNIPTSAALKPFLSYPTSKAAASTAFMGFCSEKKNKLKVLRIFQAFGEGEQETRFWPSMRKAAISGQDFPMTEGLQIRDFIEVNEVTRQLLNHLDFKKSMEGLPEIHHIATGKPEMLITFARRWWAYWGAKGKLLPGYKPYNKNEIMCISTAQPNLQN